jgi:choice-of-anchor A domain-containing protein/LPXTG-motif cell wall-anchored protein
MGRMRRSDRAGSSLALVAPVAVAALAVALVGPILVGAPAAAAPGECPPGYLPAPDTPDGNEIWTDDNVAVFAGGDFLADGAAAESEGVLVVMGDAVFDKDAGGRFNVGWVGVGSQATPTPGSVMLAVGGALTVGDTTTLDVGAGAVDGDGTLLGGDVQVGTTATPAYPAPQYALNNGSLQTGMGPAAVADWATFDASIAANSASWVALPDNGSVTVSAPQITFTGDGTSNTQIFTVAAAALSGITEVYFVNIADDAPVVINVEGAADIVFSPNYFAEDGVRADDFTSSLFGLVAQRTMWNFADATSVTFGGSSQFLGSVMAPVGDFDITASMNGRVYAGGDIRMHGGGNELHNYPWIGAPYDCLPIPDGEDGSVQITKTLDSVGVVEADREFFGWIECTGEGIEGDYYQEGVIRAGQTITVEGLPIGSQCEVFEDAVAARSGQAAIPPGFVWAEPVWTVNGEVVDGAVFTVVGPDDPVQVEISVTNTLLGRFAVTKEVVGPAGAYVGDRAFEIAYACDADAYGDDGLALGGGSGAGSFDLAVGESATSDWFPVGTTCTVSEETPAPQPGEFEPDGAFAWQTPTIDPASLVVGDGDVSPLAVTVTNTYVELVGSFAIEKVVVASDDAAFDDSFSGSWTCTRGADVLEGVWTLSSTDAPLVVADVPVGSSCTVTEDTPVDPEGATWSAAQIAPASFTVTDADTRVAVTVTNTLTPVEEPEEPGEQPGTSLPATGTEVPWVALAAAGALLAGGAAVLIVAGVRRRHR